MAPPRPLARPPIREALIDFRIASDPGVDAMRLGALRDALANEYPLVEEKREVKAEFRVEGGRLLPPSTTDLGFGGLVFSTEDKSRRAQCRRDGFTFNQVAAYNGADAFIAEAIRLWGVYREVVRPFSVVRTAMRYINGLELPLRHGDDFSLFLTAAPPMPLGAPQQVSSFLTRTVAHEPPDVVIVTQKLEHVAPDAPTPVTIDVDVFRQLPLGAEPETLEPVLRSLRTLKNRVFFALLTEATVELYA